MRLNEFLNSYGTRREVGLLSEEDGQLTPKNEWRLAPAYDLTSCAGLNGEHTVMVNGRDRDITDADLIDCHRCDLRCPGKQGTGNIF